MSAKKIGILSSALELKAFTIRELAECAGEAEALASETINEYRFFFYRSGDGSVPKWKIQENAENLIQRELRILLPPHLQDPSSDSGALSAKIECLARAASEALSRAKLHRDQSEDPDDILDEITAIWTDLRAVDSAATSARRYSTKIPQKWLREAFRTAVGASEFIKERCEDIGKTGEVGKLAEWEKLTISLFRKLTIRGRIVEFSQKPKLFIENELVRRSSFNESPAVNVSKTRTPLFLAAWQQRLFYMVHVLFDRATYAPQFVVNIMYASISKSSMADMMCITKDFNDKPPRLSLIPSYLQKCKTTADGLFRIGEENGDQVAFFLALSNYNSLFEYSNRFEYTEIAASAKNQIGNTKLRIGVGSKDSAMLQEAEESFAEALTMIRQETARRSWVQAMNNLGSAQLALGSLKRDKGSLENAISTFNRALLASDNDQSSIVFVLEFNKGNALIKLSECTDSCGYMQEAQRILDKAAERASRTPNTVEWAIVNASVGKASLNNYSEEQDPSVLDHGISAFGNAYHYFSTEGRNEGRYAIVRQKLNEFLVDKKELLQKYTDF